MDKKKEDFTVLLKQHKGIIFKVSALYYPNTEDQKDLAQDIITELWRSFDRYDASYKYATWMYRIALNVAISQYRKSVTYRKHISTTEYDFVQVATTDDHIEDIASEKLKALKDFINTLDELNKALMVLYLENNSHQEIAEILSISVSNVGTKIGRIKIKLKQYFKEINNGIRRP